MEFICSRERRKLEEEWVVFRPEYAAAGMSEADIDAMYRFDRQVLNRDRAYYTHTQFFCEIFPDGDEAGEDNSPLIHSQLEHLCVGPPEISECGRYGWIEDLNNPELSGQLRQLPRADLEYLSYRVVDHLSCADIAYLRNVSRAAVTQRYKRIAKKIRLD